MEAMIPVKKKKYTAFFIVIISIIIGFFIEIYFAKIENSGVSLLDLLQQKINLLRLIILIFGIMAILYILNFKYTRAAEFIHRYRFFIAGVLFIILVIFQISGSSIGMWLSYVNDGKQANDGTLLGVSRPIRSDEWNVNTSMAFSQSFSDYSYYSEILRGDETDTFIVYGQPVKDISIIFRPFQIGYILFGNSYGLSFFWCSRLIALFLVTYEFGLLITKKDKLLSFLLAIMITYAPLIQWWFAINGLVEMIVFMELALVMLHKYMTDNNLKRRILYLLVIMICAGGYILTFYPAWQIPLFFVLIGFAIWIIIQDRKEFKINYKDIISIVIILMIFLILMGRIIYNSFDTIKATLNTAYPGSRVETGGAGIQLYITYAINIFYALDTTNPHSNVCEESRFYDLFPIGLILIVLICLYKKKKPDLFTTISLVVSVFLGGYIIFGYPQIVCKLTMLSYSTGYRAMMAVGYLNVVLLIYQLTKIQEDNIVVNKKIAFVISLVCSILITYFAKNYYDQYLSINKTVMTFLVLLVLYYLVLRINCAKNKKIFSIAIVCVIFCSSFLVNPIRTGTNVIYEQELSEQIQAIVEDDENALWIYEGEGLPNFLILNGASTINSTNVYPDLERWSVLDQSGKYEEIYNRYAHITMILCEEEPVDKFYLNSPDNFTVYITKDNLEILGVSYILTQNELELYNEEQGHVNFELVCESSGYKIYKVNYVYTE